MLAGHLDACHSKVLGPLLRNSSLRLAGVVLASTTGQVQQLRIGQCHMRGRGEDHGGSHKVLQLCKVCSCAYLCYTSGHVYSRCCKLGLHLATHQTCFHPDSAVMPLPCRAVLLLTTHCLALPGQQAASKSHTVHPAWHTCAVAPSTSLYDAVWLYATGWPQPGVEWHPLRMPLHCCGSIRAVQALRCFGALAPCSPSLHLGYVLYLGATGVLMTVCCDLTTCSELNPTNIRPWGPQPTGA
jgi:hypothetical protein